MAFRAAYKKQPGILVFSSQQDYVEWSPNPSNGGSKTVKILVKDVTSTCFKILTKGSMLDSQSQIDLDLD